MDHRHVLATAKPRWKDKLTKAVEDAERYLAGMSVPQIMFARKGTLSNSCTRRAEPFLFAVCLMTETTEANEEVKTASKRKAHKQPMQPALESGWLRCLRPPLSNLYAQSEFRAMCSSKEQSIQEND